MENILIVYWSGTGNTKKMAEEIRSGIVETNNTVTLIDLKETTPHIDGFKKIMLGCPATSKEQLEGTIFLPFLEEIKTQLADKKVALFGSYGWGDGEWMRKFEEIISQSSAVLSGSLIIKGEPEEKDSRCLQFGKDFANS